jgi:hypothetical protein
VIDFVVAALLLVAPVPAVTAVHGAAGGPLICASGGRQAAVVVPLPRGVSRISGVARRTVARPGGRRSPGVTEGFQLRIGLMDAGRTTVAGMFLASGSPEPGPPQPVQHYFGSFGRDRRGVSFESAQPLDRLFSHVLAPGDPIRFAFEIAPDGALRLRASWDGNDPHEAGGLVHAAASPPTQLVVQCEVDDFSIEELLLR